MDSDLASKALTPWIELLCKAGDERGRDRLLVECVVATGCAQAAALWRAGDDAWREVLARGPRETLPRHEAFEALRRGALPAEALSGVRVLRGRRVALALGGIVGADDQTLDPIEALLALFELVELSSGGETVPSALPARAPRGPLVDADEDRQLRHDLANVLLSWQATEDLLRRLSGDLSLEETRHYRRVVDQEATRAGELLATAFAPRTAGSSAGEGACVAEVLAGVLAAERASNDRAHVRVETFVDPAARRRELPLAPAALARVFQNLLVNAREALARRGGGQVWVTVEPLAPAGTLAVRVEDDGPGLPEADLERVFEPGFSTKAAGSDGQGLSIVRTLIEAARGSIRARNRSSGGAAFEMTFPP